MSGTGQCEPVGVAQEVICVAPVNCCPPTRAELRARVCTVWLHLIMLDRLSGIRPMESHKLGVCRAVPFRGGNASSGRTALVLLPALHAVRHQPSRGRRQPLEPLAPSGGGAYLTARQTPLLVTATAVCTRGGGRDDLAGLHLDRPACLPQPSLDQEYPHPCLGRARPYIPHPCVKGAVIFSRGPADVSFPRYLARESHCAWQRTPLKRDSLPRQ